MKAIKKILKRLTLREIKTALKTMHGWRYLPRQKVICVEYKMKDFMTVVRAIQKIARLAQKANHHPDLFLTRYRHLKILCTTHESGGVTKKDIDLAKSIKTINQ